MAIDNIIEAGVRVFKEKLEAFCGEAAESALTPDSAEAMARGLQQVLSAVGGAAYGAFLEGKDEPRDVVVRDGETYRFKYVSEKTFTALWGAMRVKRRVYQNASDTKTYVPLDVAWNMEKESLTLEVREAVNYSCAFLTPVETAQMLSRCAWFKPHATQIKGAIENLSREVAGGRDAMDARIREAEQPPEGTRILAASLDGTNVLMRGAGAKPRAACATRQDEESRKTTAYKNAMVGSVSYYGEVPEDKKTPKRLNSRYVTHMPEERAPTFKARFEAELDAAEARAPHARKVLILDGARALWKYIQESDRFNDYDKIIDYWHVAEHLSLAADAIFGKGTDGAKNWYEAYRRKLLEEDDGAERALRSMNYHYKKGMPKLHILALLKEKTFFQNNKDRMSYADFRRRGLPIGSGPVEAACKTLVKHRLCRSGQRWSTDGGQRILDLRTYVKSNRWDAFWNEYKQLRQEKKAA